MAGGWIVDAAGWRWTFVAVLPVAALAFALALRGIRESRGAGDARAPLDWSGAALVSLGLLAAIWGLVALPDPGQRGTALAALALGVAVLAAFLWVEARKAELAMVPLVLFADAGFSGLTAFTFFLYAALGGLMLFLPYVLIADLGYSAARAGLALLPLPLLIGGLSRLTGGAMVDRYGTRTMLTAGATLVALGFLWLTRLPEIDVRYAPDILPGLVLLAVGMALAVAPLTTAILSSAGDARSGTASGVNNATSRIGGLIATALLGFVLTGDLIAGLRLAAWVGAGLAALSAAVAWRSLRA